MVTSLKNKALSFGKLRPVLACITYHSSCSLKFVKFYFSNNAEVVKLANTLRSGRSGRKLLRVRIPSSANLNHGSEMVWVSAKGGSGFAQKAEISLPL